MICNYCKKEIETPAMVKISGAIILPGVSGMPNLFKCKEHEENYARTPYVHADCWIDLLQDVFGLELHDMTVVLDKYKEQHQKTLEAKDKHGMG